MTSYDQYCGLAKALERVGDRWTLLIIRELLTLDHPARYSDLVTALPGIATNLLARRLKDLCDEGLVRRLEDPPRLAGRYELTEIGRGLEEPILALVRWGGRWMSRRRRNDTFRPEWFALALKALRSGRRAPVGTLELRVEHSSIAVAGGRGGVSIRVQRSPDADAVIGCDAETAMGLFAGVLDLRAAKRAGRVEVSGDQQLAVRMLAAFGAGNVDALEQPALRR